MSTFAIIDILDDALFNRNFSCGIVSYSLDHAQYIFKKVIGHALQTFPNELKPFIGLKTQSTREVSFANGSSLRVDTTLRGGSYQAVLISEFGKTCARSPLKAEEVITGTLQAVSPESKVIIESTGEGNEGYFAQMCQDCAQHGNENLSPLDYYLHFYPWYIESKYSINHPFSYEIDLVDYFHKLEDQGISLTQQQKYWYAKQQKVLGNKVKQEFPSTISEAFLSSTDAYYFAHEIQNAYETNRVLSTPLYDPLEPVYVAMDIGVNDLTVIIFYQFIHGEIRVIDYYEDNNKGVDFYAKYLLQDKPYLYHTIYLPHDAARRDGIIVENTYEREFKRLFTNTETKFFILPRHELNLGISQAKIKMNSCVFASTKVKPLLDHLSKYRKRWSEATGQYLNEPLHDIHSHHADAFRYAMQSLTYIEKKGSYSGALQKHKEVVENRSRLI